MISRLMQMLSRSPRRAGPPRVMAYCASNVGMGHYFRLTRVIAELKRRRSEFEILLATDAPIPPDKELFAQTLQLPRFRFVDDASFKEAPLDPGMTTRELREWRAAKILETGQAFQPDALFMDTNPHGKRDELLPLLKHLRGRAKRILMMRDIPCPPGENFKLNGAASQISKHAAHYERILLAGDPTFFDAPASYDWPEPLRRKTRTIGFVVHPLEKGGKQEVLAAHPALDANSPLVVASFGGGWDVAAMADHLLRGLREFRRAANINAQLILATGTEIDTATEQSLQQLAHSLGGVEIRRLFPDYAQLLAQADLAILQSGSTPFQILDRDIPIVLTVRDYKSREQDERARRLAALPGIKLVERDSADWENPAAWLAWGLESPPPRRETGFNFNGIANAAQAVLELLPQ